MRRRRRPNRTSRSTNNMGRKKDRGEGDREEELSKEHQGQDETKPNQLLG